MTVFWIPLPPKELSPNGRVHWSKKSPKTKEYRESVGWLSSKARAGRKWPLYESCQIEYEIIRRRVKGCYLPRDTDNAIASLKAAQDGMKDGGLFADDSHGRVRVLPPVFTKPPRNSKEFGIKVTVSAWDKEMEK